MRLAGANSCVVAKENWMEMDAACTAQGPHHIDLEYILCPCHIHQ